MRQAYKTKQKEMNTRRSHDKDHDARLGDCQPPRRPGLVAARIVIAAADDSNRQRSNVIDEFSGF
jgi:hypothetical protein